MDALDFGLEISVTLLHLKVSGASFHAVLEIPDAQKWSFNALVMGFNQSIVASNFPR